MLTPPRYRGVEILDDPGVDPAVRARSLADVAASNRWFGGLRAAIAELYGMVHELERSATLLDVGTGAADIPAHAAAIASNRGISLTTIGVDYARSLLATARLRVTHVACASAFALPFRDHSVDVVMCSQLLHHFDTAEAVHLVRELDRVARRVVIVSDLRRSWFAAAGFWLAAVGLRFHRVTRHDGVVSVLRGFTSTELAQLVRAATGVTPVVHHRLGYRLTTRWTPLVRGEAARGAA